MRPKMTTMKPMTGTVLDAPFVVLAELSPFCDSVATGVADGSTGEAEIDGDGVAVVLASDGVEPPAGASVAIK